MNKIKKWLTRQGYELIYEKYYTGRNYGGRSFYNDGTYGVDRYTISNTNYSIDVKCTGRPKISLLKNNKIITLRYSQDDFIKALKEYI
jgi:hypothetical protein